MLMWRLVGSNTAHFRQHEGSIPSPLTWLRVTQVKPESEADVPVARRIVQAPLGIMSGSTPPYWIYPRIKEV